MKKVLIFTDNHFCETSSVLRQFGVKYSLRLENQIESLNWLEKLAIEKGCAAVICAGDFFDKPNLTDSELTALQDIAWNGLPHFFLVGNHESSVNGLRFNSTKALESDKRKIISEPTSAMANGTEICFLPYAIESDRKPVSDYFGEKRGKRIIISHNDLLGIQMGPIVSKTGFAIEDLEANADLIINGHLHNGQRISNKIINLGNLTGQNFGEDALRYKHNVMILDVDDLSFELIENPFAFNFYKIEIKDKADSLKLRQLKSNAVVSISCADDLLVECKTVLGKLSNIICSRLIVFKRPVSESEEADKVDFSVDYIAKFIACARNACENNKILEEELNEICH